MTDEETIRAADEMNLGPARDTILEFIGNHEQVQHGGGCCLEERINAICFLAHSLGLRSDCDETWVIIRKILNAVYEAHHCPPQ